jgi:hypothetical protein
MSFHYLLTEFLSFFPLILQGLIALVMIRRKLVTIFPFFFSYTVIMLSTSLALDFLPYGHRAYSLLYWSGEALGISLGLAATFEILRHILPPYPSLTVLLTTVGVVAALAAVIATVILASAKPGRGADNWLLYIVLAERCLRFLQVSLLIVVIALMSALGLTWHHESLGILVGFGVYAAVALVVYEFGYHLHLISTSAFLLLNSAGYNVAVFIWAFYMLRARRRPPVERLPDTDLVEWNDALRSYVNQRSPRG